ncbi:MAG: hypothetical protein KDC16_07590 [Saprospiraceae bacterium]|nr:hypothetical protein [Saprospiraceae bacterium]MCB9327667.1 hypothetical protein [Lewinellaceae bacterium]HPK10912.1 hypothetical protein [Saprospiraceae bacterium]
MKKKIHIDDLHFEHVAWKNELAYQRDELKSFEHRLEEVAPRYTDKEVLKKVEHFQNQFIRHFEVLDILDHDINVHEDELSSFAKEHPVAVDHVQFHDHKDVREKVETQREIYQELKDEFLRFLTETM